MNKTDFTPLQLKYLTPLQLQYLTPLQLKSLNLQLKLLNYIPKIAPVMVIFVLLCGAILIRAISALQPDTNRFAEFYRTYLWLGVAGSLVGALLWIMMPSFSRSMFRWGIKLGDQAPRAKEVESVT